MKTVTTPPIVNFGGDAPLKDICSQLNKEFNEHNGWTDHCSELMRDNPHSLLIYDRQEYSMGNAYGSSSYKLLLNLSPSQVD